MQVIEIILIILKLLGQVPALLDKYQKYRQDANYKTSVEKLDAAFDDFIKAKASANIQGQLNALNEITRPK